MNWNIESCIIFETTVGSQMYGTSTPESDKDFRGCCIPPWEIRNSLLTRFDQMAGSRTMRMMENMGSGSTG